MWGVPGGIVVKALSLWQPWASLMAIGAKRNETRSRRWNYTGDLAICSALFIWRDRVPDEAMPALARLWENRAQFPGYHSNVKDLYDSLPFGKVLCVVHCNGVQPSHLFGEAELTQQEFELGDYSANRWIYPTGLLRRLVEPVAVRGHQGLFDLPADVDAKVRARI
jgi:hypothetical protein